MRNWRYWAILGLALACLYVTRGTTLPWIGQWMNVGEPPRQTDYTLILNGGPHRAAVGAALINTGYAEQALVVEMHSGPSGSDSAWPPWHEVSQRILVARGVLADRVQVLQPRCQSTADEAFALARFLRAHPRSTVTVVTSDFHTRRARWIFRQRLGAAERRVHFVGAPADHFNHTNWWRVEEAFVGYLSEYLKLAFYVLYYGQGLRWLGALGLLACGLLVIRRRCLRSRSRLSHA